MCMHIPYSDYWSWHNCGLASNILLHQTCSCQSPLQCNCAHDGGVCYVLGDLDLLCLEGDSKSSTCTHEVWDKMVQRDPAGTMGMKPPEVGISIYNYHTYRAVNLSKIP